MSTQTVWIEIPVKELERAVKFYQAVFEVSFKMAEDDVRRTATVEGSSEAGVGFSLNETKGFEPSDKGALVYLDAGDDLSPTLARIQPAGGKVTAPKTSMGAAGFYATFLDTEGNTLALYSPR